MNKNPFITKTLAILAIVGLLMLALGQIGYLTDERQGRFAEAVRSIERAQSGRQALVGPVLQTVCKEEWDSFTGTGKERTKVANKRDFTLGATPTELKIQTQVQMEPRYRGLFKVNTYAAKTSLQARWDDPKPEAKREQAGSRLSCEPTTLMVAVSDGRGIRHARIQLGDSVAAILPGTENEKYASGFHTVLPEEATSKPLSATITLELVGTTDLAVAPIGDDTQMQIAANWPHPSFGGRFLPVTRDIGDTGFSANWQISSLATTAARDFFRGQALCAGIADEGTADTYAAGRPDVPGGASAGCIETFGVAFIDPVNPYSLSDRAVKYGLLFIGLSFVAVAMVEVLRRLRVHPVQYLLVGLALSMFFLLLLSLSEHLSFALSYLIASTACVALLTFYAGHLLKGWKAGLSFGSAVAALYGGLYLVLQMEQTALVVGSVLLFAVLAAVMTVTRRVDWYNLAQPQAATAPRTDSGQT